MAATKRKSFVRENLLSILMLMGVFCGAIFGYILKISRDTRWTPREVMYVNLFGELFLRMLKGLIIPLMVASVVSSVGSLDFNLSKKIGFRTISWFVVTTLLAVTEGIVFGLVVQPGKGNTAATEYKKTSVRQVLTIDTILDLLRSMFPDNIVKAAIYQYRTVLVPPKDNNTTDLTQWNIKSEKIESSEILGLVTFSVVLGIAIGKAGPTGSVLLKFFESLLHVVMLMTTWVIWLSPLGIFFLISAKIIETENFASVVIQLGPYFITATTGLIFHGYIMLPFIYFLVTRKSPIDFLKKNIQAIITAFGTGSSNATLPVAMQCIEENCGVDPRISGFVMPMGATLSKDGTAFYEALAVIFVSQVRHIPLSFGSMIVAGLISAMVSSVAAGVPHQGLITMVMVLDTVGLPTEDASIIFVVDWVLERVRTAVNVSGDSIGAGVVAHLSQDELEDLNEIPVTLKNNAEETTKMIQTTD